MNSTYPNRPHKVNLAHCSSSGLQLVMAKFKAFLSVIPVPGVNDVVGLAKELHTMINLMQWAAEESRRTCQRINTLITLMQEIKTDNREIRKCLNRIRQQLQDCLLHCKSMNEQHKLKKLVMAHSVSAAMKDIEKVVDEAVVNLSVVQGCSASEQTKAVSDQIDSVKACMERDMIHPTAGAYPISAGTLKPPAKVSRPVVDIEGDQMIISWDDPDNYQGSVRGYELRYDDTRGLTLPVPASCKSFSLGFPKVIPGKSYTIQVRAINGRGPGDWSEHTITRFKSAPPDKPDKPILTPIMSQV